MQVIIKRLFYCIPVSDFFSTWLELGPIISLGLPGSSLRSNWQSKYSYIRSNFSLSVPRLYDASNTHCLSTYCTRRAPLVTSRRPLPPKTGKMSCLVRFAVPRLINLLKFWRSITHDSLGNARVVYIFATRYACVRRSLTAKGPKIQVFCTFWRNPFTDFDDL